MTRPLAHPYRHQRAVVAVLTAATLTAVVGAKQVSLTTSHQQLANSVSTPTEETAANTVELDKFWQIINESQCKHFVGDVENKSKQIDWIRLSNHQNQAIKCLKNLPNVCHRVSLDIYWMASSGSDVMVYTGSSPDVVATWDYLTTQHKALEVIILLVVVVVLVSTLVGNILVLATMVSNRKEIGAWQIVRVFLAITDLLRGAFVMTLSTYDTLSLMTSANTCFELSSCTPLIIFNTHYEPLIIPKGNYRNFCALAFEITSVMSLQCLAWLALERLAICRYSRAKKFFTIPRVAFAVVVMWILAITFPLVIFWSDNTCTFFDPITKLTILLPNNDDFGRSQTTFVIQCTYLTSLFSITFIASVKAMRSFTARSKEEITEMTKHTPATQVNQQKKVDRHIKRTMKLIFVAYFASVTPRFFLLIPDLRSTTPFLYLAFWWMFVLSSSWNWYLYNMRSIFFRNHLARLILSFPWLPEALESRLKATILPTSALNPNWGPIWCELDNLIRRKSSNFQTWNRTNQGDGHL